VTCLKDRKRKSSKIYSRRARNGLVTIRHKLDAYSNKDVSELSPYHGISRRDYVAKEEVVKKIDRPSVKPCKCSRKVGTCLWQKYTRKTQKTRTAIFKEDLHSQAIIMSHLESKTSCQNASNRRLWKKLVANVSVVWIRGRETKS